MEIDLLRKFFDTVNATIAIHKEQSDFINLAKDMVIFIGACKIFSYLKNRSFERKADLITKNLEFRDVIENKLEGYVLEKSNNGKKDIGLRFVFWKNYPWQLDSDGYIHHLNINFNEERTLPSGWINNTGLNFQEHLWFLGKSIYVDKNGIFFTDSKGISHRGFIEYADKCLLIHLPFKHIVNFDFKERIEYEPILYTKYKYDDYRLFDDLFLIKERYGQPYFRMQLSQQKQLYKYSLTRYVLMRLKLLIKKAIRS